MLKKLPIMLFSNAQWSTLCRAIAEVDQKQVLYVEACPLGESGGMPLQENSALLRLKSWMTHCKLIISHCACQLQQALCSALTEIEKVQLHVKWFPKNLKVACLKLDQPCWAYMATALALYWSVVTTDQKNSSSGLKGVNHSKIELRLYGSHGHMHTYRIMTHISISRIIGASVSKTHTDVFYMRCVCLYAYVLPYIRSPENNRK